MYLHNACVNTLPKNIFSQTFEILCMKYTENRMFVLFNDYTIKNNYIRLLNNEYESNTIIHVKRKISTIGANIYIIFR